MPKPYYRLTGQGLRLQEAPGRLGQALQGGIALLYDQEDGGLLVHGDQAFVEEYRARLAAALAGTSLAGDLAILVIPLDQLTPGLLNEINRAIQVVGYVATLATRLSARPSTATP